LGWLRYLLLFAILAGLCSAHRAEAADDRPELIRKWEIRWIYDGEAAESNAGPPREDDPSWTAASAGRPPRMPADAAGLWVRFEIPPTDSWRQPALLIDRLYGRRLAVYLNGEVLHETNRTVRFDVHKLLLPLPVTSDPAAVLIRIDETVGRGGVYSNVRIGEFDALNAGFIRPEIDDMALSGGMIMIGLIMLACSGFLTRETRKFWLSLSLIALSAGTLVFTSSPLPYMLFESRHAWLQTAFELAFSVSAPAFMQFADIVFQGRYPLYSRFRRALWGYAALSFLTYALHAGLPGGFEPAYELIAVRLLNLAMTAAFAITAVLAAVDAFRGNRNGAVLCAGVFFLTSTAAADFALYFARDEAYEPVLWKFGTFALLVTLTVILSAELARNHAALIAYAKEREEYNRRLQRAEKLRIISDLAASVAHEVRNPLQVTRGFLQLLAEREVSNRRYYDMAIEELDRASSIITDFLTFAKPEMEEFTVLDLSDELEKIHAIMSPHASLNGVALKFDVRDGLRIEGNSSRFKQAIINFIKNGIEATENGGEITVRAYREGDQAVIRIRDTGSGMDEEQIAKLGTPYFSTKTKGTGLGLMVTFRIIEAMNGSIHFESETGKGTEVTLRFPAVLPD